MTHPDVKCLRIENGQCPDCGMQTYERRGPTRRLFGLTNDNVLNGRCLICMPLHLHSGDVDGEGSSALPTAPASDRTESNYEDVELLRFENGQCPCGMQTHGRRVLMRSLFGLTNDHVLDGRCLVCMPLHHRSGDVGGSNGPDPAPPPYPTPEPIAVAVAPDPIAVAVAVPMPQRPPSPTSPQNQMQKRRFQGSDGLWGDYFGSLNDRGERHGRGAIKWEGGDEYVGEWKDDKREGRGMFWWADGRVYGGDYKDDKREGRGTYRWADGKVYEGEWKDDSREGQGMYRLADGCVYEGGWKDDKMEGRGTYRWADGDVYEGEWKDDRMEGRGTYRHADGKVYKGKLKDDKMEGRGTFWWADGRVDVGQYRAGNETGEGVRWSADRRTAYRLEDGRMVEEISLAEAAAVAGRIGLPVPEQGGRRDDNTNECGGEGSEVE